jgi:hypothetical protein
MAPPAHFLRIALGLLVLAPACYDLPHIDPGPRWIDQFTSDAGMPTWGIFAGWTCGTEPVPMSADGGRPDAGTAGAAAAQARSADAAVGDAGDGGFRRMPCQLGAGDGDPHGLDQPFAFADASNDVEFTVTTQASSAVNFTAFHTFTFRAWVRGTGTTPLPPGTAFRVELVCSQNRGETLLAQNVGGITINGQTWDPPFFLDMAGFHPNSPCLTQIDGIRFVVGPGQNILPEVVGTVSLDSVGLQN